MGMVEWLTIRWSLLQFLLLCVYACVWFGVRWRGVAVLRRAFGALYISPASGAGARGLLSVVRMHTTKLQKGANGVYL
jgi:hypothetical protein